MEIDRDNAWPIYQSILEGFRRMELGLMVQNEMLSQSQLHSALLEQSQDGSTRADIWGYDSHLIAPMRDWLHNSEVGSDGDGAEEIMEGEFSGEEDEADFACDDW